MNFLDVIDLSQFDPTLLVVLMTAGFIITFIFAVDSAMAFDSFIPFVVIMTIGLLLTSIAALWYINTTKQPVEIIDITGYNLISTIENTKRHI